MKQCPFCGGEYSDQIELCPIDQTRLKSVGASQTPPAETMTRTISSEERFWSRMTFKELAALLLRIQALWLFFNAVIDATYLSRFANLSSPVPSYVGLTPSGRLDLLMLIFRIILNVAVGFAVIQNAENILSWLVKDHIRQESR